MFFPTNFYRTPGFACLFFSTANNTPRESMSPDEAEMTKMTLSLYILKGEQLKFISPRVDVYDIEI